MMRTECVHCKKKFDDWNDYAHHILEKHSDDDIRMKWAKEALAPTPELPAVPEKRRLFHFRGKLLDRISPKRQKKLPKHIRQQIDEYIREQLEEDEKDD